jgi:hypothetical protein
VFWVSLLFSLFGFFVFLNENDTDDEGTFGITAMSSLERASAMTRGDERTDEKTDEKKKKTKKKKTRKFYGFDPWTKERVKLNSNGEEVERADDDDDDDLSSEYSSDSSDSERDRDTGEDDDNDDEEEITEHEILPSSLVLIEEYGQRHGTNENDFDDEEDNENEIALLQVNATTTSQDPRNYCFMRFRWCWKFDSLSWWVAICFLLASLFVLIGSACSCFKRVTRNPKWYVRAELVPYLIGGLFFLFASALTLWASYRTRRRYNKKASKNNKNNFTSVLIKQTQKLELIGAVLTLIGSGLFVAEIIATMVIADSAHWTMVPVNHNTTITNTTNSTSNREHTNSTNASDGGSQDPDLPPHHGHWWYHDHFDTPEEKKQFVQMSTVVEVNTGYCGAIAYLLGSWFYWCASKREWVWNPFRLPNGAHEKISFYSLVGSWLFLLGAIMTPPASSFAVANKMSAAATAAASGSSSSLHNSTSSLFSTLLLKSLTGIGSNTNSSISSSTNDNNGYTSGSEADHKAFVKGAFWLFIGYVLGSVCYCVQALLMVHTIALAEQRKQNNSNNNNANINNLLKRSRSHHHRHSSNRRNIAI